MSFENHQWAISRAGLISKKPAPTFEIEARRLVETTERACGVYYDWPLHVSNLAWVDREAFLVAFRNALTHHAERLKGSVDLGMLRATEIAVRSGSSVAI